MNENAEMLHLIEVVRKWAARCGLDDNETDDAVAIAWDAWDRAAVKYPAGHWARFAVRSAKAGRTLRGVRHGVRSAWRNTVLCGAMNGVVDTAPGPERQAQSREAWGRMLATLNGRCLRILTLAQRAMPKQEIAVLAGCSPARVSQVLRLAVERYRAFRDE